MSLLGTPPLAARGIDPDGQRALKIKTKNCVPNEDIRSNIAYAMTKPVRRWLPRCKVHDGVGVFVSGGPTVKDHLDEIRELSEKPEHFIVTVKHSHDFLIDNGVIPWACMLLDPRDHVKDFIETPHEDVIYIVASMCHPSTWDRLLEANATIFGYHAAVGADEAKVLTKGHHLVTGGSTAATRGVSVLHMLGFRNFITLAYDSCFWEPQDTSVQTKTGHQKFFEVTVNGRKFWSDAELVAQAQDFETMLKQGADLRIEVRGDGLIPHIKSTFADEAEEFEDVFGSVGDKIYG